MQPPEPWIRLAQANIILGQHENACRLLITASEYEPQAWQVWRDLTTVSASCSHFAKAATSYRKALELNPLYGNEAVLKKIVSSLINGNMDETYHSQVRTAACELFQELTNIFPGVAHFWCMLGVVLASEPHSSQSNRAQAVEKMRKAMEIIQTPHNKWYSRDSSTVSALEASQLIVDCLVNVGHLLQGTREGNDSLKLALSYIDYITNNLERYHSDFLTRSVRSVFLNHYNLLKRKSLDIKVIF